MKRRVSAILVPLWEESMRTASGCGFWLIVALAAFPVFAQAPGAPPVTTFKAQAELVLVPTIVTGAGGTHVTGLEKKDFLLRDNGKVQDIAVFEEIRSSPQPAQPVATAKNEFTNYLASDKKSDGVTILLVDLMDLSWEDWVYARDRMLTYLSKLPELKQPTTLLAMDFKGVHILQDFTTDPKPVMQALKGANHWWGELTQTGPVGNDASSPFASLRPSESDTRAGNPSDLLRQEMTTIEAVQKEMMREFEADFEWEKLKITAVNLQLIARNYGRLPGRKSMVWINDTRWFRSIENMFSQRRLIDDNPRRKKLFEAVWKSLADAQIATYPVSALGLVAPGLQNDKGNVIYDRQIQLANFNERWRPARDLADATGGTAYYGLNNPEIGFQNAEEDSTQYYLLAYYAKSPAQPGWHKLEVATTNRSYKVRARQGFQAFTGPPSEAQQQADFAFAMASDVTYTDLPFKLTLLNAEPSGSGKKLLRFRAAIPAASLAMEASERSRVLLDFGMVAETPGGSQPVRLTRTVQGELNPTELQTMRAKGLTYESEMELDPGDYSVRIVVRDRLSGKIGSISVPYKME